MKKVFIILFSSLLILNSCKENEKAQEDNKTDLVLEDEVNKSNDLAEFYVHRCNKKFESGDYKGAILDCTTAIEINPIYPKAYFIRAQSKSNLDDYEGAISDYSKTLEAKNEQIIELHQLQEPFNPNYSQDDDTNLRKKLGDIYEDIPNTKILKGIAIIYTNRGIDKKDSGDYKGAISDYTKAIEFNPNNSDAYFFRGFLKRKFKQYKAAISDLDKAIEINPDDMSAYVLRSASKASLGDKNSACKDARKAKALGADIPALIKEFCN